MPGRRLLVPAILALAFVASSYAATTVRAAGTCIAKPNAAAPQGEHWYYRTDRVNNRQCWYLGPIGTGVQKSTTRVSRPPANARAILKALLRAQRPVGIDPEPARAAIAAEANVGLSALAGPPEAAKLPDPFPPLQPTPEPALADELPSAAPTNPTPASKRAEQSPMHTSALSSPAAAPAQATGKANQPSGLIVLTLALLAMFGPAFHAARWLRRRKDTRHRAFGRRRPSTLNRLYAHTQTSADSDSETERITQALQQLLDEMQTKQYAPSRILQDRVDYRTKLDNDQTPATDRGEALSSRLLANHQN